MTTGMNSLPSKRIDCLSSVVPTGKPGIETVPLTVRLRVLSGSVSAKDSVIRAEGLGRTDLPRGRDKWWALVKAVTNFRIPYNGGYGTVDFSRNLLRGVSA